MKDVFVLNNNQEMVVLEVVTSNFDGFELSLNNSEVILKKGGLQIDICPKGECSIWETESDLKEVGFVRIHVKGEHVNSIKNPSDRWKGIYLDVLGMLRIAEKERSEMRRLLLNAIKGK